MILLIDVGSTRLKWASWNGEFKFGGAIPHNEQPIAWFTQQSWRGVTSIWISLVPRIRDIPKWTEVVQSSCGLTPQFVQSKAEWNGLRSSYTEPEKLGSDRWLTMVALWHEQRRPFCVVSAGTALTFDRVDAQGQHLGGVIAPGFGSMHRALIQATKTSFEDVPHRYGSQLGRDSLAAIRQGAFFATMGVIGHAVRSAGADPNERRIITSGDAAALQPYLEGAWEHHPYLVLQGLLAIARESNVK